MSTTERPESPPGTRLTQSELAHRWKISPRSLEKWRTAGLGPDFLKIGGRVRYREEDVLAYEAEHLRGAP